MEQLTQTELKKLKAREYSRGYQAGLKRAKSIANTNEYARGVQDGRKEIVKNAARDRYDQLMAKTIRSLLVTDSTHNWVINGEKVNNAALYAELARLFVNASIKMNPYN